MMIFCGVGHRRHIMMILCGMYDRRHIVVILCGMCDRRHICVILCGVGDRRQRMALYRFKLYVIGDNHLGLSVYVINAK